METKRIHPAIKISEIDFSDVENITYDRQFRESEISPIMVSLYNKIYNK